MTTRVINLLESKDYSDDLRRASAIIRNGGLVGFPTETVYGVATRGDDRAAVTGLRRIKDRVETKPFTVHVGDPSQADDFVTEWSSLGKRLVRKAWPGPLTLVVHVAEPDMTTVAKRFGADAVKLMYHECTVGLRCPSDSIASDLLREAAVPVVAASANRGGNDPPRTAEGVLQELSGDLDLLLDGGRTQHEKPSTVVRIDGEAYRILREGVFDARTIDRLATVTIVFVCSGNTCRSPMAAAIGRRVLAKRFSCSESELADRRIHVESAGVAATDGLCASTGAVAAMSQRDIDLGEHRSRHLDAETAQRADLLICMTRAHRDTVLKDGTVSVERVLLLSDDEDIEDPFGGGAETYERCAERIAGGVEKKFRELAL